MGWYRQWKDRFYAGPDWIDRPAFIAEHRYRSVTVMMSLWLYAAYVRLFSVTAQVFLPALAIVTFYSLLMTSAPLSFLTFLLWALFFADFVAGFVFRPRIKFRRHLPSRVAAGAKIRVVYDLFNAGRTPCFDLDFDAVGLGRRFPFSVPPVVRRVAGGAALQVSGIFTIPNRGCFHLPRPLAKSGFPLGFFTWNRGGADGDNEVLVHPSFHSLTQVEIPLAAVSRSSGQTHNAYTIGDSAEFASCREFVSGDDPRRVSWKTTARVGKLIVNEYIDERNRRVALIVETYCPPTLPSAFRFKKRKDHRHAFEAALSLTASLVDYLERNAYELDLLVVGRRVYQFHERFSRKRLDAALDILAATTPSALPVTRLSDELMDMLNGVNGALYVTSEPALSSVGPLRQMLEIDLAMKAIAVADNAAAASLSENMIVLTPDDIVRGLVQTL